MKITNEHMFKLMEIIGVIGIDVELEKTDSQQNLGISIINTILKNSHKAQPQIESLVKDLSGMEVNNPIKLLKAINKLKKDKEVRDFFMEALKSFQ